MLISFKSINLLVFAETQKMEIQDETETNLTALRRTVYLTVQSSLDFEECAHKMMKMEIKPGQEVLKLSLSYSETSEFPNTSVYIFC